MRPARLLRPMKEVGHYNLYGRWHELVPPEEGAHGRVEGTSPQAAAMAAGRGPGRGLRRQRRAEKLQAVYQARRTEREARKAMAKVRCQSSSHCGLHPLAFTDELCVCIPSMVCC